MIAPIHHFPVPALTARIIAPATAASSKLEKDTVYMPSNVAARVLGRASQESSSTVTARQELSSVPSVSSVVKRC